MPQATYSLAYDRAFDASASATALVQRVVAALADIATDVQAEATGTTNHANRAAFAKAVLADPVSWGPRMTLSILVDTNFATTLPTDAELKSAVSAAWNAFAGTL